MKRGAILVVIRLIVLAFVLTGFVGQGKKAKEPTVSLEKHISALEVEIAELKVQLQDSRNLQVAKEGGVTPVEGEATSSSGGTNPKPKPLVWTEGRRGWEEDGTNIWTSAGTTPSYNVGIGTNVPAYKLDVRYNASIYGYLGSASNAVYGVSNTSTGNAAGVYGVGTHDNSVTTAKGVRGIAPVAPTTYVPIAVSAVAGADGPGGWFWGNNKSTGSWWSSPGAGLVGWGRYGLVGITNDIGYGGVFGQATEDGSAGVWGKSDFAEAVMAYYDGLTDYGLLVISGAKSCAMLTSKGNRALFSVESPEVIFVDYGSGKLNNGKTSVKLDPTFLEVVTIDASHPYRVVVTPTDVCNGVYVVKKDDVFEVVEVGNGTSNATFDYQVIAYRKGYEDKRFPEVKLPKRHRTLTTVTSEALKR